MWAADRNGSIDDVVATMHSQVSWCPLTRPGLSRYSGHDGIRRMRDEVDHTLGVRRIQIDEITLLDDGSVASKGRAIFEDDREPLAFDAHYTFRDGLIFRVDSTPLIATIDSLDPTNPTSPTRP
jgi:hypothetical protein